LREIELIEEPKQLATRRPSPPHVVGAGEFGRKFLLPEHKDFKFGYGAHSVPLIFHLGRLQRPLTEQILAGIGCHRFRVDLDESTLADSHHFDRGPGILCPNIINRRLKQMTMKHLDSAAEEAGNCPATRFERSVISVLFRAL
jgi:hypothetical protein